MLWLSRLLFYVPVTTYFQMKNYINPNIFSLSIYQMKKSRREFVAVKFVN